MADTTNNIQLMQAFTTNLGEITATETKTAVLDTDSSDFKQGMNANEIGVPRMTVSGLADYNRGGNCQNGYVGGSVSLEYDSLKFNYDRGRQFCIDSQDDSENGGIFSGGALMSKFVREEVIPETDAFKFASYYGAAASGEKKTETLATADAVIASISAGSVALDNAGVKAEDRYLFVNPTIAAMIANLETYKSKAFLANFKDIITVPAPRFYTAITLMDGVTSGEENGGYTKATGAQDINYMIIPKSSVLQYTKHVVNKVISPEAAQYSADAWKFMYRVYGLYKLLPNKHIWASAAPAPTPPTPTPVG